MLKRIERRSRYRECLELEAQYGQFMPCEAYADPDDLAREAAALKPHAFSSRFQAVVVKGLRKMRDALLMR